MDWRGTSSTTIQSKHTLSCWANSGQWEVGRTLLRPPCTDFSLSLFVIVAAFVQRLTLARRESGETRNSPQPMSIVLQQQQLSISPAAVHWKTNCFAVWLAASFVTPISPLPKMMFTFYCVWCASCLRSMRIYFWSSWAGQWAIVDVCHNLFSALLEFTRSFSFSLPFHFQHFTAAAATKQQHRKEEAPHFVGVVFAFSSNRRGNGSTPQIPLFPPLHQQMHSSGLAVCCSRIKRMPLAAQSKSRRFDLALKQLKLCYVCWPFLDCSQQNVCFERDLLHFAAITSIKCVEIWVFFVCIFNAQSSF